MQKLSLGILMGLLGVVLISVIGFAVFQPIKVLPRIKLAPAFKLWDKNSLPVTNEDFRGSFVLYSFLYAGCEMPCKAVPETLKAVQSQLSSVELGGIPFQIVIISFDPINDTPDTLPYFEEKIGASGLGWKILSGKDPQVMKTIIGSGFQAYYQARDNGGFVYDPIYILVDGQGVIRGQYQYDTLSSINERIVRHVGVLANEVIHSVGVNRYAYEAAHLFLCYSP